MKTNRFAPLCLLLLAFQLFSVSAFPQVYNGVYADTNNQILPGFTLLSTAINGTLNPTNFPATYASTNQFIAGTNQISTNALNLLNLASNILASADKYNTNWLATNSLQQLNTASNFVSTNVLGQLNTASNFLSTNILAQLNLGTNWASTNSATQLFTASNLLALAIANDLFNWTTASNNLAIYGVAISNTVPASSNNFMMYIAGVSNTVVTASNANCGYTLSVSNSLKAFAVGISNQIVSVKAFTATLPATFTSQGQGFSTPLMLDGNYSVSLTPQDQATATSGTTNHWYVGSKNASGFTIYIPVQNAFNLNFDCTLKENTQ